MILDNGYVSWSVKVVSWGALHACFNFYFSTPTNILFPRNSFPSQFVASYYTSLSFVAYPFDKQLLTILFRTPESPEYADGRVVFRPSTAGLCVWVGVDLCVDHCVYVSVCAVIALCFLFVFS